MNNLISIIIPCYNQGNYLAEAMDSVLAQTYQNWECIVINDGSTDHTETIAKAYLQKDKRFKYLKKENGGLSSTRNAGLNVANGSWIQFLDADDYLVPEKFELSVKLVSTNPLAGIIVTDFKMFTDNPLETTPAFCELKKEHLNFEHILFSWGDLITIPIHCGLFRAELFYKNLFVESLKVGEDWVMWLSLFQKEFDVHHLNVPLAYYRINPASMTKNKAFVTDSMAETFKYILQIIPQQCTYQFTCNLIGMYNTIIKGYENDLVQHKNRPSYRIEKTIRYVLNKFSINNGGLI